MLKIKKYIHRDSFILEKVKGMKVLHLGCIGETDSPLEIKIEKASKLLHHKLEKIAQEVYGIDIDAEAINAYIQKLSKNNLLVGDVEHLEEVKLFKKFDVILFTDLMEHLSNPGLALEGIKRFMDNKSEVIFSVPHSFGLPNYIRYICGRFKEGNQHVANYNYANINNLLKRHGFKIIEVYTGYEKNWSGIKGIFTLIPITFMKIFPKYGGTLIVVATLDY